MPPSFDRIARPYRWLEYLALGPMLARCRNHFLPRLTDRRHALVLGDGDGRFTARLLATNRTVRVDAIDISATMLRLLARRSRASARGRLRTFQISALAFDPAPGTDLVVAHFFFDCLAQDDLDALVARLVRTARPDALWLVSDFRIPPGVMWLPAQIYVRLLYLAFRLVTGLRTTQLPDFESSLSRAGLVRVDCRRSLLGVLTTEIWHRP